MPLSNQVVERACHMHPSISVASRPAIKAEAEIGEEEPNSIAIG